MKVVIFAGGYGTRLSEETDICPKPMVEIGGKPILWHIMKIYSHYGHNDFIILLGYKGYYIKEYFSNYFLHQNDVTFDMVSGNMKILNNSSEPWTVTLIDTGLNTKTAGRIKRAQNIIGSETFLLTYGDGLSNVNINELVSFHKKNKKTLTMTSVQPESRFGVLEFSEKDEITRFSEKPKNEIGWINGGFFVCEPEIFNYLENSNDVMFESTPMNELVEKNELVGYKHYGFWKCMDTLRDKKQLNKLLLTNKADWMVWE